MSVFRSAGRLMAVLTALLVLPAMLVLPQSASASEAGHSGSAIAVKVHVARDAASGASPRTCYAVSGHFISRYNQNPGGWGCAVTPEYAYLDGTYQEFANGEMDWSPSQGGNMVVSGLRYPGGIYFQFGPSDPFNYDAWLVRISQEGGGTFQPECSSGSNDGQGNYCDRSNGAVHLGTTSTGHWQIITEGCDVSWTGSHTCRQSWTIPVDIWY
ncbi:hypothetical protein RVR_1465 [Actinacidiphila reveromycinica]|uniref:Secreted protein n=1 Tax=Actinacidiphila reveromycinica TaxID=659352 RepID=A0A7U3UPA5_9ACTN|nr:hypothetical protein [Streptomyces sp. SN-593]BBA96254.1 hypothetical protein RVR_1465 [Streptomyces sp. SN-593]